MKEQESHHKAFDITTSLNGRIVTISIQPEETTDGVEYFNCISNDKNISQIREEKVNNWEQLWGELDPETVNKIGIAIDKELKKS